MRYVTTKCGHCKTKWEFLSSERVDILLGPPVVKCSSCGGLNKTKHKLYRDMNFFQKSWFFIQQGLLRIIYNSGIIVFGILIPRNFLITRDKYGNIPLVGYLEDGNYFGPLIITGIGLGISWFGYNNLKDSFQLKGITRELEKRFDDNGGFLWSNEFYNF